MGSFDITRLENNQKNCLSGIRFGLRTSFLSTLPPPWAVSTLQRPICVAFSGRGEHCHWSLGLNKGAYNGYFVFCLAEERDRKSVV